MWPSTDLVESLRVSSIACYSCRRRKVKCDRRYPVCSVCDETAQVCNYPEGPLKPGPKLGSLKRPRKRRRSSNIQDESPVTDPPNNRSGSADGGNREKGSTATPPTERRLMDEEGLEDLGPQTGCPDTSTRINEQGFGANGSSHVNIQDLSFILHPSHENSSPDQESQAVAVRRIGQESGYLQKLSSTLGLRPAGIRSMVAAYFDNMVSITLFREPHFDKKLTDAVPTTHIDALLTSMIAYAVRFCSGDILNDWASMFNNVGHGHSPSQFFLASAFGQIDKALNDCGDEPPSLCILQALIIATHCQLTQGVRGKAWRSLGMCIRLAYELNLHLVDSGEGEELKNMDAEKWCQKEEKRRAWWAIWEMDVFASTIRRTPPAIDWSQMETLLPVEDEHWFNGRPQPSCFMEGDPIYRWKALHQCGNQSPKSWFLVINSLMKQAQVISSPRSVPHSSPQNGRKRQKSTGGCQTTTKTQGPQDEAAQKLETLANSVRCFMLVLPESLRYRNQCLSFEQRDLGQLLSTRQLHCAIYNIYVMTHLAKLMIYRYDVFSSLGSKPRRKRDADNQEDGIFESSSASNEGNLALMQYFEAADNILTIVNRSCDGHIRYINPFLSSTIWLASAVQIFRKEFEQDETSRIFTKSKFEVLYMTYKQCVSFWNINTALQQNLEALETQLENYRQHGLVNPADVLNKTATNNESCVRDGRKAQLESRVPLDDNRKRSQLAASSDMTNTGNEIENPNIIRTPPSSVKNDEYECNRSLQQQLQQQPLSQQTPTTAALSLLSHASSMVAQSLPSRPTNIPTLDYMHLPYFDGMDTAPGTYSATTDITIGDYNNHAGGQNRALDLMMPISSKTTIDDSLMGFASGESPFGQNFDWRNTELSSDIHDLLSGYSTY